MSENITIPTSLFISEWVLLLALGILVIVMYRQLASLMGFSDVHTEQDGLPIGEAAPTFKYISVNGTGKDIYFQSKGNWSVLLFTEPTCQSCQKALKALENLRNNLKFSVQTLVVTSAELTEIQSIEAFSATPIELVQVKREVMTQLYHNKVTPFAYVIDPEGTIRSKGGVWDESSFRKLLSPIAKGNNKIVTYFPEPSNPK